MARMVEKLGLWLWKASYTLARRKYWTRDGKWKL